jgi:endonuclease/exonuclease/phosphatase family metal-dependent hydrolase
VLNCHLQSNSLTEDEITAVNQLKNLDTQKHEDEVKSTYRKLSKSSLLRSAQVDDLAEYISRLKHRTLVCGDFNDVPTSYTYHKVSKELNDAFVGSGVGVGDTYNGKLPPLRIDYIFYSSKVEVIRYDELDALLSDHYPVKASFALLN